MEYLTLNEKTFIKANKIARELGYTADYIGQLCRAGKVEAQLVGRTWYVEEKSIRSHKQTRYRSTKAVTQKFLQQSVAEESEKVVDKALHEVAIHKPRYEGHRGATIITPRYGADEAELIPLVKEKTAPEQAKTGYLSVKLAGAENIAVSGDKVKTVFTASKRSEIKFKGKVGVKSAEDEVAEVEASGETVVQDSPVEVAEGESVDAVAVTEPKVTVAPLGKRSKKRWKHPGAVEHLEVLETPESVDSIVEVHPAASQVIEYRGWSGGVRLLILMSALIAGCVLAVCLLSISHRIFVDSLTIQNGYILNLETGIDLIRAYLSTYLG